MPPKGRVARREGWCEEDPLEGPSDTAGTVRRRGKPGSGPWAKKWDAIHPGPLPTRPAPSAGTKITISVAGLPPYKDVSRSLRNRGSPQVQQFVELRTAAAKAMSGRRWWDTAVRLDLVVYWAQVEPPPWRLVDYLGGVMDTLDGSHGPSFTFLPLVYQDDSQICGTSMRIEPAGRTFYEVTLQRL